MTENFYHHPDYLWSIYETEIREGALRILEKERRLFSEVNANPKSAKLFEEFLYNSAYRLSPISYSEAYDHLRSLINLEQGQETLLPLDDVEAGPHRLVMKEFLRFLSLKSGSERGIAITAFVGYADHRKASQRIPALPFFSLCQEIGFDKVQVDGTWEAEDQLTFLEYHRKLIHQRLRLEPWPG